MGSDLAEGRRIYWDTNAWLGLICKEAGRENILSAIWREATKSKGKIVLLTSVISMVETFRLQSEKQSPKPLQASNDRLIEEWFNHEHIELAELDVPIARTSRRLRREHPLERMADPIHLATALRWNADEFHTWDTGILALNGKLKCEDGSELLLTTPSDGPLFAGLSPPSPADDGGAR